MQKEKVIVVCNNGLHRLGADTKLESITAPTILGDVGNT